MTPPAWSMALRIECQETDEKALEMSICRLRQLGPCVAMKARAVEMTTLQPSLVLMENCMGAIMVAADGPHRPASTLAVMRRRAGAMQIGRTLASPGFCRPKPVPEAMIAAKRLGRVPRAIRVARSHMPLLQVGSKSRSLYRMGGMPSRPGATPLLPFSCRRMSFS